MSLNFDGEYFAIRLYKNAVSHKFRVHKLVALCFLPIDNTKLLINHKDGVKTNNYCSNLERCTVSENSKHAIKMGLSVMPNIQGIKNGRSKLTNEQVIEIRNLYPANTLKTISQIFKIGKAQCSSIINKKSWKHI